MSPLIVAARTQTSGPSVETSTPASSTSELVSPLDRASVDEEAGALLDADAAVPGGGLEVDLARGDRGEVQVTGGGLDVHTL